MYLIDDFIASGTTALRQEDAGWTGKLSRFWEDAEKDGVLATHFEAGWTLCVHHYIATHLAYSNVRERDAQVRKFRGKGKWFEAVEFTSGMQLQPDFPLKPDDIPEFAQVIQNYYDDVIETPPMKKGGDNARFGFAQCALPLVLEHNTPNNSIALLWAETPGANGRHSMRPLFRRRNRHT